ncbi:MAG: hypothetical protein K2M71_11155, partial [Duncaniella sp.]|nr:hypothetical protein [Duncaniella sp.]
MALNQKDKLSILQCISLIQSLRTEPGISVVVNNALDDVRSRLERVVNGKPLQLTDHFSLEEFLASPTAVKHGITLSPPSHVFNNLVRLCTEVLEPARRILQTPIYVSSGYRNQQLNRLVGGVPTSLHLEGRAADISIPCGLHGSLFNLLSTLPHT